MRTWRTRRERVGPREVKDEGRELEEFGAQLQSLEDVGDGDKGLGNSARTWRALRVSRTGQGLGSAKRTLRVLKITKIPRGRVENLWRNSQRNSKRNTKSATRRNSKMLQKMALLLLLPQPWTDPKILGKRIL